MIIEALAQALRHRAPALVAGLPTTSAIRPHLARSTPRVSLTRNAHFGATAGHELTLKRTTQWEPTSLAALGYTR